MGARISSRSGNKPTKKFSRAVIRSDTKSIAVLVLELSKDVSTAKQMLNEIDTSEDIGQKIQQLQNQFNQIDHNIDQIVKDVRELQQHLVRAESTQDGLLGELRDLLKSLSSLDAENQRLSRKANELQKMALGLKTGVLETGRRNA